MLLLQLLLPLLLLVLLLALSDTPFHRVEGVILLAEPRAGALRRPRTTRRGVTHRLTARVNQRVRRRSHIVATLLLMRCDAKRHAVLGGDVVRYVEAVSDREGGGDAAIGEYRIDALLHLCTPVLRSDHRQRRTT